MIPGIEQLMSYAQKSPINILMETTWLDGFVDKFLQRIKKECHAITFNYVGSSTGSDNTTAATTIEIPNFVPFFDSALLFSAEQGLPLRSLSFTHEGRPLFLSTHGKRHTSDLGLNDGSVIRVSTLQQKKASGKDIVADLPQLQSAKKKNKKKPKKAGSKKKVSTCSYEASEEEKSRQAHSERLGNVFAESADRFKAIREKLDAANLQRTQPKTKSKSNHSKNQISAPGVQVDNPSDGGVKAGKSRFIVRVGDPNNLYKALPLNSKSSAALSIDFHGCTKEETVATLDRVLPKWIDAAMQGEYPWVVRAEIICGGGCQVLRDAVGSWIQQNTHVANAPKGLC